MSLHDDFGMYYNTTFVGVKDADGHISPFWIEHVSNDDGMVDLEEVSNADAHGDMAYEALVFNGQLTRPDGQVVRHAESMIDNRLVLDSPDPQYVKIRNRYHWVSYRASRSTKKGLCDRRIVSTALFNHELVSALFNQGDDENIIGRVFLKRGNELEYKGVVIGEVNGDNFTLVAEAAHLAREIQKELPECQITVLTEAS